jgi:N-acetylglutamate synthase-like GNAT family acetyltransferase
MSDVWVRKAEKKDISILVDWLIRTKNNLVDPSIFLYPLVTTLAAFVYRGLVAFLPLQITMTLESLAISPDASKIQTAAAIAQLIKMAVFTARNQGIREVYFLCADNSTAEFALHHGFEELHHRTFRLKLDSLEDSPAA